VIRSTWPALTAALLLGLAGALPAGLAAAHAIVLESSPVHDAVLARSPEQVTLRFNSKLEKRFTRITLAAGSQPPAPVTLPDGDGLAGPDRVVFGTDSSFFPRGWQRTIYEEQKAIVVNAHVGPSSHGWPS